MQLRTDTELDLGEIDTTQAVDNALKMLHADVVIVQCYAGATPKSRCVAAQSQPLVLSGPRDIARQAAEGGKAAARDSLAGGVAAEEPGKLEAGEAADADMHDDVVAAGGIAEADAGSEASGDAGGDVNGGSVFDTALDFLQHLHSLRRITCTPLPGSQARASAATSALGDGDGAAAPAPAPLPRVEIEVQKDASYVDAVVALSDKLRENGVQGCASTRCQHPPTWHASAVLWHYQRRRGSCTHRGDHQISSD